MNGDTKAELIIMRFRRLVELVVLLLLSGGGVWWGFGVYAAATAQDELTPESRQIMYLEERLAAVPDAIADVRVIGYLDGRFDESVARRDRRYKMTRYVLAPTLVINSADGAVILADFPSEAALDEYLAAHPFEARQRLGAGLAIVEAGEP